MSDKCHFCGIEYHPMTVWTKVRLTPSEARVIWAGDVPTIINVCSKDLRKLVWAVGALPDGRPLDEGCEEKAREAGYEPRPDLTPKR